LSDDKSNPDISEDIQTEPPISEISETSEAFRCDICGKIFPSEASLRGHLIRAHRTRDSSYSKGPPIEPMASPIPDLIGDLKNIKSAVEFARWRDRLKMQAPDLYRVFFPTSKSEASEEVTSKLVNLEALRIMRQIREEMEGSRPNNSDSALTSLQSQLEGYKEELARLREELHKKDIDFLTQTVQDLKQQINTLKGSTSDLVALVREAKDLGEKWIRLGGGPMAELFLGQLGFVKVPATQTKVITEEAEQSEKSLIEKFAERGWIAEG
jgi:hypothetical protein